MSSKPGAIQTSDVLATEQDATQSVGKFNAPQPPVQASPIGKVQAVILTADHSGAEGLSALKLSGASWVSVFDKLAAAIQVRHYSPKTLQAYRSWIRQFQNFTHSKAPELLNMDDVKNFLTFLAVQKKVAG